MCSTTFLPRDNHHAITGTFVLLPDFVTMGWFCQDTVFGQLEAHLPSIWTEKRGKLVQH
jgi:hypothetical protein